MGSEFYTLDEAANRLSRTKRMVQLYIKKGLLTRKLRDGKVVLLKSEVEQLAIDLGTDLPPLNRQTIIQLFNRVQKLENDMALMKIIWDIKDHPLRPSEAEASGLYRASAAALAASTWSIKEIEMWAGIFLQMDELALESICKATALQKAWEPFFNLCLRLMDFVSKLNKKQPSLEAQALEKKLEEGRKKLRGTILMWIEMGKGGIPESFILAITSESDEVLRNLTRRVGKSTP